MVESLFPRKNVNDRSTRRCNLFDLGFVFRVTVFLSKRMCNLFARTELLDPSLLRKMCFAMLRNNFETNCLALSAVI